MARPVRERIPVRRGGIAPQTRYQHYRADLRADFAGSCGYCDDNDERADKSTFHIDHFAPKKQFPALALSYENLVYSCRFCNVSKSDHWIGDDATVSHDGERGFVDPCSSDYDAHLHRTEAGKIAGTSALGTYMVKRLNLRLIRHELLWRARRARALRQEVDNLLDLLADQSEGVEEAIQLLKRFRELTKMIDDYEYRAAQA